MADRVPAPCKDDEVEAAEHILDILAPLSPGARERVLRTFWRMTVEGTLVWALGTRGKKEDET